jgi:hypothetical protein
MSFGQHNFSPYLKHKKPTTNLDAATGNKVHKNNHFYKPFTFQENLVGGVAWDLPRQYYSVGGALHTIFLSF